MTKDKWIWMPHAGHLIVGHSCRFRLNTYIGKYIVSTVGEYWPDRVVREIHAEVHNKEWLIKNRHLRGDAFNHAYMKKFGYEDIGFDRKFETMVFEARKSKYKCCPYEIIVEKEVDMDRYNSAEDAYNGHLELCAKWSRKS